MKKICLLFGLFALVNYGCTNSINPQKLQGNWHVLSVNPIDNNLLKDSTNNLGYALLKIAFAMGDCDTILFSHDSIFCNNKFRSTYTTADSFLAFIMPGKKVDSFLFAYKNDTLCLRNLPQKDFVVSLKKIN